MHKKAQYTCIVIGEYRAIKSVKSVLIRSTLPLLELEFVQVRTVKL